MKKILLSSVIFLFAAAIGLGIYTNQSVPKESNLIAQNVEALADYEPGSGMGWPFEVRRLVNSGLTCWFGDHEVPGHWFECQEVFSFQFNECAPGGARCVSSILTTYP